MSKMRESFTQTSDAVFKRDVLDGLKRQQKQLPPKYFYDARGAELFEKITKTKEYYLTESELDILTTHGREIADTLGDRCRLIECGNGSSMKTKYLLDQASNLHSYVPIDISEAYLSQSVKELDVAYPELPIHGICADYTEPLTLPTSEGYEKNVVFFPGSSFGNFEPVEGELFLSRMDAILDQGDGLLIGVDLKKDPAILHAAYNDREGYTAAFNKNILTRMNREMGAEFDLDSFVHYAFYEPAAGRIEMHVISEKEQVVQVGTESISFQQGESIHTENSYKFTIEDFTKTAETNGFSLEKSWTDTNDYFAVLYFER